MPLQQQASKAREVVLMLLPVHVSHPVKPIEITPAQPIAILTDLEVDGRVAVFEWPDTSTQP